MTISVGGSATNEVSFILNTLANTLNAFVTGQLNITPTTTIGGERLTSSNVNNYDSVRLEANRSVLISSAAAQNIGTGGTTPVFLIGATINGTTTGTITFTGFTQPDGVTAATWVIAAGTFVNASAFPSGIAARCETGLTVTCSVAADGPKVLIDWRPI